MSQLAHCTEMSAENWSDLVWARQHLLRAIKGRHKLVIHQVAHPLQPAPPPQPVHGPLVTLRLTLHQPSCHQAHCFQ